MWLSPISPSIEPFPSLVCLRHFPILIYRRILQSIATSSCCLAYRTRNSLRPFRRWRCLGVPNIRTRGDASFPPFGEQLAESQADTHFPFSWRWYMARQRCRPWLLHAMQCKRETTIDKWVSSREGGSWGKGAGLWQAARVPRLGPCLALFRWTTTCAAAVVPGFLGLCQLQWFTAGRVFVSGSRCLLVVTPCRVRQRAHLWMGCWRCVKAGLLEM